MKLQTNKCYYITDSEEPFLIVKTELTHSKGFDGRPTVDWINYLRESNILSIYTKGLKETGIDNIWVSRFKITEIQENEIPHYLIMSLFITYNKKIVVA